MNQDDGLEERLRTTLAGLLDPAMGDHPTWGTSPQAARLLAAHPRPWARLGISVRRRVALLSAICVAVVLAATPLAVQQFNRFLHASCAGCAGSVIWAVAPLDESHVVAVGGTDNEFGKLFLASSDDGGRTWSVSYPDAPALTTMAVAGSRLVGATACVQPNGQAAPTSCLYASDDSGKTWQDLHAGLLVDPSFSDASHGFAHTLGNGRPGEPGEPTAFYSTTDAGNTWREEGSPCDADHPWITQAIATAADAAEILCVDDTSFADSRKWELVRWQTSGARTIVASSDNPDGIPSNTRGGWLAMSADGVGYVTALRPLEVPTAGLQPYTTDAYRTIDGGASWTLVSPDIPTWAISSGKVINNSLSYFAMQSIGNFSGIAVTRDAGATWTELVRWPWYG